MSALGLPGKESALRATERRKIAMTPNLITRRGRLVTRGILPVALVAISFLGCGEMLESGRLSRRPIATQEVPESVMESAKKALPEVQFADAWKNLDKEGKLHSYEIRGRNQNGKIREVRVSPSGDILELE